MTGSPEGDLEDRLRQHYRYLRERQPVEPVRQRRSPLVAIAACVAALVVAGGAALVIRDGGSGQPLQTRPGSVVEDDLRTPPDPTSVSTTEVTTARTEDPSEATTAPDDQPSTDGASGLGAGSGSSSTNVDGSAKAPPVGTVAPPPEAEPSLAYGIWEPGRHDSCSKAIHDRYWVYGPDGKVYPTHHPPIDPATGCMFGHEHGRDPADSDLADIPFPFGYVNEQATAAGLGDGNEDHVGHKIEWADDVGYYRDGSPNSNHDLICDVAYQLDMGSHSDEAFAQNANEVFHYARCDDGVELVYRALHPFGRGGEFNMHCDQQAGPIVTVGPVSEAGDRAPGGRELPAALCFEDRVLVPEGGRSDWFPFDERWVLYQSVDSADFGRFFIQFNFFVDLPSRYWDGTKLARTVDLCYLTGPLQVRDDEFCEPMRSANPDGPVPWDDPASPFNGADRRVFMVDLQLDNDAKQNDWYTDISGGVWSAEPFPGSIRQHVGTTPISAAASYRPDPIRRLDFADDLGIHAPN